jgi:Protein of unknown function (DUF2612)
MTTQPPAPTDLYLGLVTSEHNQRPKFTAWLSAIVQPFADEIALLLSLASFFDLDYAIGDQLDRTGEWILPSRYIKVPLDVYFTFDDDGRLGWDHGIWWTEFDPLEGLVRLTDDMYRLVLYCRVAANHWDGSIPAAYDIYNRLFAGTGSQILIQDNGDMSMIVAVLGKTPDAIMTALLTSGLLDLRPSAVLLDGYVFPTIDDTPYFGFDVENSSISGWDTGAWGKIVRPIKPT